MADTPQWGDGLSRLVVASAIYGRLIDALPNAFTPELFGESQSPRWRIAKVIADYVEKYGSRPTASVVDEELRRAMEPMTEAQQESLAQEWQYVQDAADDLPDDPAYVYDQVRSWIDYRRLEQALLEASTRLGQKGVDGLAEAREILAAAEPVSISNDRMRLMRFLGDAEERLELWRSGEEAGERVPTGLPQLDAVLNGGPTKRETWYFLAPPKGAKTLSLIRVARAAALRGKGVYLTTFEMQAMRMLLRADRMAARQTKEELRADLARLQNAYEGMRTSGSGEIYVQEQPTQRRGSVAAVAQIGRAHV